MKPKLNPVFCVVVLERGCPCGVAPARPVLPLVLRLRPEPAVLDALVNGDAPHLLEDLVSIRPERSLCPDAWNGVGLVSVLYAVPEVAVYRGRVA